MARRRTFHIDDSELRTLELDISKAPGRIQRNASDVLRKAGRLIDKGMRADASGHRFLPNLQNSVSHELLDPWTVEIGLGPTGKAKDQGSLAHIIAHGSVNNAPVYDHTAALRRSTPAVVKMFADAAEDSVLGGEK